MSVLQFFSISLKLETILNFSEFLFLKISLNFLKRGGDMSSVSSGKMVNSEYTGSYIVLF